MSEHKSNWFDGIRGVFTSVIRYTAEKTNIAVTSVISIIVNHYGKRILKLENDNIIEKTVATDNMNTFYLLPLIFKPSEQRIGTNILTINSGCINGVKFVVKWKNMLKEPTIISIDSIDLDINVTDREKSIYFSSGSLSDLEYSYLNLTANINTTESIQLLEIYGQINNLLIEYFSVVNFEISTVKIKLNEYFTAILSNIEYSDNTLRIDSIRIISESDEIVGAIKNIVISKSTDIFIENIEIASNISNIVPSIFLSNKSNSNKKLNINIGRIKIDDIIIINIDSKISNTLTSISVTKITLHDNTINNICIDIIDDIYTFKSKIDINIIDVNIISKYYHRLRAHIKHIESKIKVENIAESINKNNIQCISNISVYINSKYDISIELVKISDNVRINKCQLSNNQDSEMIFINNVNYGNNQVLIKEFSILSTLSVSNYSGTVTNGLIDLSVEKLINIHIDDIHIVAIDKLIPRLKNQIISIINIADKFNSSDSVDDTRTSIMLNIINGDITHRIAEHKIFVAVGKALIDIINVSVSNAMIDISIDDTKFTSIDIEIANKIASVINQIKIYADIKIINSLIEINNYFDEIKYTQVKNDISAINIINDYNNISNNSELPISYPKLDFNNIDINNSYIQLSTYISIIDVKYIYVYITITTDNIIAGSLKCLKIKIFDDKIHIEINRCKIINPPETDEKWRQLLISSNTMKFLDVVYWPKSKSLSINLSSVDVKIKESLMRKILKFTRKIIFLPGSKITIINRFNLSDLSINLSFCPKINYITLSNCLLKFNPININRRLELSDLINEIVNTYIDNISVGTALNLLSDVNIIKPYATIIKNIISNVRYYYKSSKNTQLAKNLSEFLFV